MVPAVLNNPSWPLIDRDQAAAIDGEKNLKFGLVDLCADQFETSTSPPPGAYPGHLTVHRAQGGGNLNVALEVWGI